MNLTPKSLKRLHNISRWAINYQPVWVDKDYLTQYAELLIHELEGDFKKGLHLELLETYKKLLPDDKHIFTSDSLAHRVEVELGLMKLYVMHINDILKEKKSKHALNAISGERIAHRTAKIDQNMIIIKESAEEKVTRIKLNLDCMKWVKRSYNRYQIWVNWVKV